MCDVNRSEEVSHFSHAMSMPKRVQKSVLQWRVFQASWKNSRDFIDVWKKSCVTSSASKFLKVVCPDFQLVTIIVIEESFMMIVLVLQRGFVFLYVHVHVHNHLRPVLVWSRLSYYYFRFFLQSIIRTVLPERPSLTKGAKIEASLLPVWNAYNEVTVPRQDAKWNITSFNTEGIQTHQNLKHQSESRNKT
jgi:hypothetical protein